MKRKRKEKKYFNKKLYTQKKEEYTRRNKILPSRILIHEKLVKQTKK